MKNSCSRGKGRPGCCACKCRVELADIALQQGDAGHAHSLLDGAKYDRNGTVPAFGAAVLQVKLALAARDVSAAQKAADVAAGIAQTATGDITLKLDNFLLQATLKAATDDRNGSLALFQSAYSQATAAGLNS